ncbi:MAG: hypothetical protein IPL35_12670 [Sphingobacteriales bacterium]|nr:hypothetical protein [Sphingobacteriales bacterium]
MMAKKAKVQHFAGGDRYGAFPITNLMEQGTYYYADGSKYVGTHKDDKFEGKGAFYRTDGLKYEGTYRDNR